jgi:hypothetical protein
VEHEKEITDPNPILISFENESINIMRDMNTNMINSNPIEKSQIVLQNQEILLDNSFSKNQVLLEDQMEVVYDFNDITNKFPDNPHLISLDQDSEIKLKETDSFVNITTGSQSILHELLGKKTFRDPNEYAKTLTKKHSLGNLKCEDVILDNDKYDKDIEMVMKYAESAHPFKLVIEFCQKFKWSSPEIDTYNIGTDENPQFKTTISIKNNTFKGEALGIQKKSSKSKLIY